jgi:putative ABC transport system permease protein
VKRKPKTPLAWKNLTHDWRRLAVALIGISFAVILMFSQVGFQNALFDSQVKLIADLEGDIFIVSKAKFTLAAEKRFDFVRIHQAQSCPGVQWATPIYAELTTSVLRKMDRGRGNKGYPIRSIGFQLDVPLFKSEEIRRQMQRLYAPGVALIDKSSKTKKFPLPMKDDQALADSTLELASKKLKLVGTFALGSDFAHDGNLLMSSENFARYFPLRKRFGDPLSVVDIGVVKVEDDYSVADVRKVLETTLNKDVFVLTREEYLAKEIRFWDKSTPIGTIFLAGKIIGFVVGMVICYQVIYSDITDHMPEFATLKAMGYPTRYFIGLIIVEAILLAIIGFLPGTIASHGLYSWLGGKTGLLMQMDLYSVGFVLAATITMCVASGMLAVRKLLAADPASLF